MLPIAKCLVGALMLAPAPVSAGTKFTRATKQAPNGYTPAEVDCPSIRPSIRGANAISEQEEQWLSQRKANTKPAARDFFNRISIEGLDVDSYFEDDDSYPNIAIAFSGGGYRAMMNGAGALSAFDSRIAETTDDGHLGGLLQSATYLAGLSGGSWLLTSLYVHNFTTVPSVLRATEGSLKGLWDFDESIAEGPSTISAFSYYNDILDTVDEKEEAGFNTTLTDYWTRALSYQFLDPHDGGPSYTFSSIADDEGFSSAAVPMPFVVALERESDQIDVPLDTTTMEFNPWEMGSYDASISSFAPIRYVGSDFRNGNISDDGVCIRGFDNAGFVMGTSSSLFNTAFLLLTDDGEIDEEAGFFVSTITGVLEKVSNGEEDVSLWPNPFYQYGGAVEEVANAEELTLVDGGEALENIPFHPLLLESRAVDVIVAVDSSADTSNWPNGTAMVATYERSLLQPNGNGTAFPPVPGQNSFVNLGLNKRPTFFGCDEGNLTRTTPLVVYLPNSPYNYYSNVSTFDPSYTDEERNNIILNGYNVATMGNATVNENWPTCLGCALLSRSFSRKGIDVPDACKACFEEYCWDGSLSPNDPGVYEPELQIETTSDAPRFAFTSTHMLQHFFAAMVVLLILW